ncbi:hypothetical protein [Noviherbaspirillum cavernae]|uniref:hypothetical protein n=1 Tax=Noviherbaspirillum cavernae TaxID=2320862 RepID=UPI0011C3DD1B|nr:hypothetical protein [Noviherbaspirillum cavernae]
MSISVCVSQYLSSTVSENDYGAPTFRVIEETERHYHANYHANYPCEKGVPFKHAFQSLAG